MGKLISIEGLPGAGKTTIVNKLKEYAKEKGLDWVFFSIDELREEFGCTTCSVDRIMKSEAVARMNDALRKHDLVFFESTGLGTIFWHPEFPKKICVLIMTPMEECIKRFKSKPKKAVFPEEYYNENSFEKNMEQMMLKIAARINHMDYKLIINSDIETELLIKNIERL